MRVAAITRYAPAISRSRNSIASRCARYWSVIVRTGSAARSISLVRHRWSSRSNGPSKVPTRSLSSVSVTDSPRLRLRLALPSWSQMHRRPDLLHRSARHRPRAATPLVQDLHDPIRFLHELLAPLADLLERRHHVLEQHVLAVETPDADGAAAVGDELQVGLRREDLVQVEHRAHVRVPRIRAALARGVRHHRAHLGADRLRRVGQLDVVAVGLRHLAAVGARYLGNLRQLDVGLGEDLAERVVEPAR